MRGLHFRKNPTDLRGLVEAPPRRRRVAWGRWVYFALLFFLVIVTAIYLWRNTVYLTRQGQVLFKKIEIQPTSKIRILKFKVQEGDTVIPGDTLFLYWDEERYRQLLSAESKRQQLLQDLRGKILEMQILKKKLARLQREYDRVKQEVLLGVFERNRLYQLEDQIEDLRLSIQKLRGQIQILRDQLAQIPSGPTEGIPIEQGSTMEVFLAPERGTVTRLYKAEHEVALPGETILTLHQPEGIYIRAFFEPKDIRYLKEGDIVSIVFPDGTKGRGRLERFYTATFPLPPEFQKRFEPTHRSIVADIVPINHEALTKWQTFYKMAVKVSIRKIFR